MITPYNLQAMLETHGVPRYAIELDFLPDDNLIRSLTTRFNIEFAVIFTLNNDKYHLFIGTGNSTLIPIGNDKILLKHSHPKGTPHPSYADILWLLTVQKMGSPQVQSVIIPIGKRKVTFNKFTYYII